MITLKNVHWLTLWLKEHLGLAVILAGFLLLGGVYSIVTPRFEAPDEIWHYALVQHLASGHGLPIADPQNPGPYRQQGTQAPLYYLLGAALTFWVDQSDWQEITQSNPHAAIGIPGSLGNKNLFIHGAEEEFPWQGSVLAVHLMRALSVLLGGVTVLLIYAIAQELFPKRNSLALGATALVAFNPQFLFIHGAVSNDPMVTATSTAVLFLCIQILRREATPGQLASLGLALGLALISKLNALGLIPVVLVAVWLRWKTLRNWRRLFRDYILVLGIAFAVAGWWYARNTLLYGDPTAWTVFLSTSGVTGFRERFPTWPELRGELWGLEVSFWGLFGWMNVPMHDGVYSLLALVSRLALAGLVLLAVRRWKQGQLRLELAVQGGLVVLVLWLMLLGLGWIGFMLTTAAAQGRYFFPASATIALALFGGIIAWIPRRWEGWLAAAVGGAVALLGAAAPLLYIAPAYARLQPVDMSTAQLSSEVHAQFGHNIRLLGAQVPEQTVTQGDRIRLELYWEALETITENYSVSVNIYGSREAIIGAVGTYPGGGNFPTSLWTPGESFADPYEVPVAHPIPYPSAGWIEVVLYRYSTLEKLPAFDPEGRPVGRVLVGRVKLVPRQIPQYQIPHPVSFRLGDTITLMGYDLEPLEAKQNSPLRLVLFWRAERSMGQDHTVFVHLVDDQGHIWAQKDNPPVRGEYPTSLWDSNEVVRDTYEVALQPGTPPGEYRLLVGMYLLSTGSRLAVYEGGERVPGDAIPLTTFTLL